MDKKTITAIVLEDEKMLNLEELAAAIHAENNFIVALVEQHLIIPKGKQQSEWRFDSISLRRCKIAISFHRDLEVNIAGVSLAMDLLDQIEELQTKLRRLNKFMDEE